jgi:20S proteasome alpha/beta subunit
MTRRTGDTVQFAEYVEANLSLNAIRNDIPLRPHASANWIRTSLASSLRSRHPYSVNLLLAGWDPTSAEPSLYWIDYLGTMIKVRAEGPASHDPAEMLNSHRFHMVRRPPTAGTPPD